MKLHEVEELLLLIQSIDRKPFPTNAAPAWLPILDKISYPDAVQAVNDHYRSYGARDTRGDVRPILPVDIRSRAHAIAEARARAAQRTALPAPDVRRGSTDRPPEIEATVETARQRIDEALRKYREKVAA